MNMIINEPRIEVLPSKILVGIRMKMSFSNNKTGELWKSFMPRRKELPNNISADLFSLQNYPPMFFENFNPNAEFEKWAAIEVRDFNSVPNGMETLELLGGLYAVFDYKGPASAAAPTFQYILGTWLPKSDFSLDDRTHFEILGNKYINEDPNSEEEIWIPIKKK